MSQVLAEHDELVAAEAGHGVARPQRPLEAPGQGHQQRVPGGKALGVVDELEAVEVHEGDDDGAVGPPRRAR